MRRLILGLSLLVGVLVSWLGISVIVRAQAAHPVPVSGTLRDYQRHLEPLLQYDSSSGQSLNASSAYDVTLMSEDSVALGPYRYHETELHPPGDKLGQVPDLSNRIGSAATIWYDEGTRNLIALRIDGTLYSMDYFAHPRAKYWDTVARGLVLGSPGFLILAGFALWAYRRSRTQVYSAANAGPPTARTMFVDQHPYPREPIALSRPASAIVADFKQAVIANQSLKARPETALADKRQEIIAALFDDVKKKDGIVSASELNQLKKSLADLQTFVPPDEARLAEAFDIEQRAGHSGSLNRSDRERVRGVLNRIAAAQNAVANFRYAEPEHLKKGVNFMVVETLKWSDRSLAEESLTEGSAQAFGCIVYAAFGITAFILYVAGQARWGSMQFWGLLIGTLAAVSLTISGGKLIYRLTVWLDDLSPVRRSTGYALLTGLLLALPVALCLLLSQGLNAISSRL